MRGALSEVNFLGFFLCLKFFLLSLLNDLWWVWEFLVQHFEDVAPLSFYIQHCYLVCGQWVFFLWKWRALFFSGSSIFWGFSLYFCLGNLFHIYLLNCVHVLLVFPQVLLYVHSLSSSPHVPIKNQDALGLISHVSVFLLCLPYFYLLCQLFWDISPTQNWILEFLFHQNFAFYLKLALYYLSENAFYHSQHLVVGRPHSVCRISCLKSSVTACFFLSLYQYISGVEYTKQKENRRN